MVKITGLDAHHRRLRAMAGAEAQHLVGKALFAAGEIIRAEASSLITQGAVSGRNHTPSAPGAPPNEDTGHLRTNITVEQPDTLRVRVTSDAEYAAFLEFGTSRMQARPYMGPALRNKRGEAVDLIKRATRAAIQRSRR